MFYHFQSNSENISPDSLAALIDPEHHSSIIPLEASNPFHVIEDSEDGMFNFFTMLHHFPH